MSSNNSASSMSMQPAGSRPVTEEPASLSFTSKSSTTADPQGLTIPSHDGAGSFLSLPSSRMAANTTSVPHFPLDKKSETSAKDQENESPIDKLLKHLSLQQAKKANNAAPIQDVTGSNALDLAVTNNGGLDVSNLKQQLEEAQDKIKQMSEELSQQRHAQESLEKAMTAPSYQITQLQGGDTVIPPKTDALARLSPPGYENLPTGRDAQWDPFQNHAMSGNAGLLPDDAEPNMSTSAVSNHPTWPSANGQASNAFNNRATVAPQPRRPFMDRFDSFNQVGLGSSNGGQHDQFGRGYGSQQARPPYAPGWTSQSGSLLGPSPPSTPMTFGTASIGQAPPYLQRPSGATTFTSPDFTSGSVFGGGNASGTPWNNTQSQLNPTAQHYIPPVEPINYRRLLDRNMSCNWKYIVDKIVCNNDQQASIFLQQKLKVSTPEQKFELVEAIIAQAYPLMINRFGNFLVQRCFEHGSPEQVIAIANAIRGKTLDLSMDAFGCHVVQKAFDVVPEEYKALMVHELLRRIPETVVHRYACHVWQKLFELRWSESPPQIMKYVNEALEGMWHEVALGETGSLVVQNIFENCLDEDKRPCIEEVLKSIDIVAHGQFGNWCIQHICEHGAPADKQRATQHVLQFATEYSTDQFASKVVEKCLKVGGSDFLGPYLEKVCEGRPDRPRMPLIDIAGDQYGNYLIQHILLHAELHHREHVAQHVRKHMVSLRGSKFGSRVAMLCTNPAVQIRPGPGTTAPINHNSFFPGGGPGGMGSTYNHRMGFGMGRSDFR